MAKKPTDDFDNIEPVEQDWNEPADDAADFGRDPNRRAKVSDDDHHDDSDFVDDDMNDIVDENDPHADEADEDGDDAGNNDDEPEDDQDFEEDTAEPQPEPQKGKLGSIIFYVIIAAVVGLGGYMAYNQVFKNNGNRPEQTTEERSTEDEMKIVVPQNSNSPIPVPVTAPEGERPATGWQTNLQPESAAASTAAAAPPSVTAVPGQVDPQLLQQIATVNAQMSSMANKVAQLTTELNTLAANTNQAMQVQQSQAAQIKALESRPASTSGGGTAKADPVMVNDIAALKTQVKNLEARPVPSTTGNTTKVVDPAITTELANLRAQVKALESRPVATGSTGSSAAPSADVASLRSQVNDLQKQLAQLKATQESQSKAIRIAAAAPKPVAAASKPENKILRAPAAEADEEMDEPRSPKSRPVAASSGSTWVLRAATPGMAWVSPQPGSAELKRITVGEQLQGIGQVQSIRQEGGRWIVEGTSGTIR